MRKIEASELPIQSKSFTLEISQEMLKSYNKAFRYEGSHFPMTLPSAALSGMFELIDEFKIDWRKLLHTYQCFEYFTAFEVGMKLNCECSLIKHRQRAGAHWLDFETRLSLVGDEKCVGVAQSRIMVVDQE